MEQYFGAEGAQQPQVTREGALVTQVANLQNQVSQLKKKKGGGKGGEAGGSSELGGFRRGKWVSACPKGKKHPGWEECGLYHGKGSKKPVTGEKGEEEK